MLVMLWFDLVHGVSARVAVGTGPGENVLYSQGVNDVEEGADSPGGGQALAGAMAVQRQFSGDGGESSLRPVLPPFSTGYRVITETTFLTFTPSPDFIRCMGRPRGSLPGPRARFQRARGWQGGWWAWW